MYTVGLLLRPGFRGTLQDNFVYAVMLNKDFKYEELYVSIFYMDFQIFIVTVYALRCVMIKKVKKINIFCEEYSQRLIMTCNPLDKHTVRTRTIAVSYAL
jgi:hypothetical protein